MIQSSLKYRPKIFAEVIGQSKVLSRIKNLWNSDDFPNAFLFHGPSGCGKTTVARIVALSLQCSHSKKMGKPCKACRRKRKTFPIFELNASEDTGKEAIGSWVQGSNYSALSSKYKIYILDEAHNLSSAAQNLLLKYFEPDDNGTEVFWFICTTQPTKIIDTLRQRCRPCRFNPFTLEDVKKLTERLLKKKESELSSDELVEELYENRVFSGRLICNAIDNYCAGESAEEAVAVELETELNIKALTAAVRKGDWADTQKAIYKMPISDIRAIKSRLIAYFQEVLLSGSDVSDRTTGVVKALQNLTLPTALDNQSQFAAFSCALYNMCKIFANRSV